MGRQHGRAGGDPNPVEEVAARDLALHTQLTVLWVAHQYLPESSPPKDKHETAEVFGGEYPFRKPSARSCNCMKRKHVVGYHCGFYASGRFCLWGLHRFSTAL